LNNMIVAALVGIVALGFAVYKALSIQRVEAGSPRMAEIAGYIHDGAMAFLTREYKTLAMFVGVLFVVLSLLINLPTAVAFLVGAILSAAAGFFGMQVATKANVRTANAAKEGGMNKALSVAFSGGAVMGMSVVGLGLLGVSIVFYVYVGENATVEMMATAASRIAGFGLGASSIALFGRVGGGIYTKAADVGADLVGKVEAGIPEDDPRNPAVIADNVGDNVGDVAGMGADLFESYVGSIISAITLGIVTYGADVDMTAKAVAFPLLLAAAGILSSIVGTLFVRAGENSDPQRSLNMGTAVSSVLVVGASYFLSKSLLGEVSPFFAIVTGLIVGLLIAKITEYYTSTAYRPVHGIARESQTGASTTIISGLSVGMLSTALPIIVLAAGILIAYHFQGLYGIALAAVGMLSTAGMTIAVDAYGPIADNAGGIAEMCELPKGVRKITDQLDAVGNTTAAIGKGFAIGSAALTALALFSSYIAAVELQTGETLTILLTDPDVIAGLLIGGMLPFLFSAITMQAVGKAANSMIEEVRRQFRDIPGLMEGETVPEYSKCVDISTAAALREMILPGLIAVIAPIVMGVFVGPAALGGMLAGSLVSGVLLAIFMANAGGAWDNAKKYIEEGNYEGKGSDAHKAAVVGDTVGDPFKDTSGPSINILIKLMTIVALVFVPLFL